MEKRKKHKAKQEFTPNAVFGGALALLALLLVLFGGVMLYQSHASKADITDHVVLNELYPDSSYLTTAREENGTGWIELYNPTETEVSLAGWALSDKKNQLFRFCFAEDTRIAPHGFLLVKAGDEQKGDEAPFRITRGSTIILSCEGAVVDAVTLPQTMQAKTAYGRKRDASQTLEILTATPNETNANAETLALVCQPVFSRQSGFYDSDFELVIDAPEGCTVYYTLDSSIPTTDSQVYTEAITITDPTPNQPVFSTNPYFGTLSKQPLDDRQAVYEGLYAGFIQPQTEIDKCAVVRAIAVDEQGNTSDVTTASYFIGYQNKQAYQDISVLSLVSDPEGLFGNQYGIMVVGTEYLKQLSSGAVNVDTIWWKMKEVCNYFQSGSKWERATHVDYFDQGKNLVFSQEAGLKMHGNTSRRQYQKGFTLLARKRYDGNELFQAPFFENGLLTDRVALVNGTAPQRYALIERMDNGRVMHTQDYHMVQVFIDGEYWGFYAIQESYNSKTYLSDHYGIDTDDVVFLATGDWDLSVVIGEEDAVQTEYQPLVDFAQQNDLSDPAKYAELCTMMDMQSFIDYYATQLYICNQDFNWHQNVYVFRTKSVSKSNPYEDGRWHWMIYDVDVSSGTTSRAPVTLNSFTANRLSKQYNLRNDPLFAPLTKNESFRQQFVRTFLDLANTVYGAEEMQAMLLSVEEQYSKAAYQSVLRYPMSDDVLDAETFTSRFTEYIGEMQDFYSRRYDIIVPAMADYFGLTGTQKTVTLRNADHDGGRVQLNTLTLDGDELTGSYYTDVPVTLTAIPSEGWTFTGWEVTAGTLTDPASAQTTLSFNADTTVTAHFVRS